jgi:hypothetical protein
MSPIPAEEFLLSDNLVASKNQFTARHRLRRSSGSFWWLRFQRIRQSVIRLLTCPSGQICSHLSTESGAKHFKVKKLIFVSFPWNNVSIHLCIQQGSFSSGKALPIYNKHFSPSF